MSVVQFASDARTIFTAESIESCQKSLHFGGGLTEFLPACQHAAQCLKKTPVGTNPILIFMSDGGGSGGQEGMDIVKDAAKNYSGFRCFTVAFGSGADQTTLQMMANVHGSKGQFRQALQPGDLAKVFVEAVGSVGKPQDLIFTKIGRSLNEQISQKLQLDWL